MPHIILEHSDNLLDQVNYKKLFSDLHILLNKVINVPISAIKTRQYISQNHFIADGNENNIFIHLQISLLSGREHEKLESCADLAKQKLHDFFPKTTAKSPQSFSVEIREMEPKLYRK